MGNFKGFLYLKKAAFPQKKTLGGGGAFHAFISMMMGTAESFLFIGFFWGKMEG